MQNNNFLLFGNYRKHFEILDGEQSKELILLLFDFADGLVGESEDVLVSTIFEFMKDNAVVGSKRRIASIENGKNGGKPPKEKQKREVGVVKETKPTKPKEPKQGYGEFKKVKLTDEQYQKALEVYNNDVNILNEAIEILDTWLESNGKTYKNYYAVLNGWVKDRMNDKYKNKSNDLRNIMVELDSDFLLEFDNVV